VSSVKAQSLNEMKTISSFEVQSSNQMLPSKFCNLKLMHFI